MKLYVATVKNVRNNKLLLEGYRNRKKDDVWKKEYASVCIMNNNYPFTYYIGACVDVVWDAENKCFKEK